MTHEETQKTPATPPDALIDSDAAAAWLGMGAGTLRRWRTEGRGPRWVQVGRLVRYRADDLRTWADSHIVETGR